MDNFNRSVVAFSKLGDFLSQFTTKGIIKKSSIPHNDIFFEAFKMQVNRAQEFNGWFTLDNVLFSCEGWSNNLTTTKLNSFLSQVKSFGDHSKTVAVIMAGNIPLVGFHDFLCVLLSGHKIIVKQTLRDQFHILLNKVSLHLLKSLLPL